MDQGGPRAGPSGVQSTGDCSDEEDDTLDLYRQVGNGRVKKNRKCPQKGSKNGGKGGKGGGKGDKGGKFRKRRH